MRHLDTESLGMLIAIVDTGGFTAAAERVGRTQSAVSARIAQLEESLGVRLLERSRRGISLTETGERLVAHARRLLAYESEALADLKGGTPEGSVRLGMPDDYVDAYFTPTIARFAAAYPRVEISIRSDLSKNIEPEVERGHIDVALFTRDLSRPTGELLKREKMLWLAARGHRPERNSPLPLALFPTGCRVRPHIANTLDKAGLSWRVACTSSSQGGIHAVVETGLCLTALPECATPSDWRRLGPAEGLPPLPDAEIALLLSPTASAAARRLADMLRAALATPSVVEAA
ncbi:HTH-type transcriptional regulator GltC [Starkeya nomas]|uniref:HTH-type transcriptional regulator GltC n=2 Tax=Xanthobacteraceae TaxID=335928 RepID=A0A5S9NJ02_9HYPH|nr:MULTISPECIES: LysR substrate-binding domain-containing protein [Xanthobacteraceae]TSJ63040.1 LysR family transcriptional regulator [Ancylobacter moscoviensis]CAA0089804.1 HTH-type transcriptional regulator GltC [Starkeya nomas]